MRTFDDYLAEARRKTGVASNNQVAALLGISGTSISRLSKGVNLPADETMLKLADLAGLDKEEALIDLSIWRSAGSDIAHDAWKNIARKLMML